MEIAIRPTERAGQNIGTEVEAKIGEWQKEKDPTTEGDFTEEIGQEQDINVLEYSSWTITLTEDEIREAVRDQLASDLYDDLADLGDASSHPPGDLLDIARKLVERTFEAVNAFHQTLTKEC